MLHATGNRADSQIACAIVLLARLQGDDCLWPHYVQLADIRKIEFRSCTALPNWTTSCVRLHELIFSACTFSNISVQLCNLKQLRFLSLQSCRNLVTLPA